MWAMTIHAPASPPEPRGANRRAVGLLLEPGPGRLTALAVAGVPLIILLLIGFITTSSNNSNDSSGYTGQSGPQNPGQYPAGGDSNQNGDGFGQNSPSPSAAVIDPSVDQPTFSATPSPDVTDSSSDTATDSASATASATTTASAAPVPTASGPAGVVLAAYADVNQQNYQAAYDLGLDRNNDTYDVFVQDYSQFSSVSVTIQSVEGDYVTASLMFTYTNGSSQPATGTYTVVNGVISTDQVQ